jgi:tetratricopeptide (TPR) repeat protein
MTILLPLNYGAGLALLWCATVAICLTLLLPASGAAAPTEDTTALFQETRAMTLSGRWDAALSALAAAGARAETSGDRKTQAALVTERGRVLMDRSFFHRKDPEPARTALQEGLRLAGAVKDERVAADARQYIAQLDYNDAFDTKDWEKPRAAFLGVLELRERLGDRRGVAETLFYVGLTYEQDGKPEPAMERYARSLAISEEIGDIVLQSYAVRHIGGLQEERGDLVEAQQSIAREIDLRRRAGFTVGIPFALLQKADFLEAHGGEDGGKEAALLLEEAIAAAEKCGSARALYLARLELSRRTLSSGDPRRALALATQALEAARAYGAPSAVRTAEEQVVAVRKKLEK